jgi:hypothetical protein
MDRLELRAAPARIERWRRAARRAGVSLSDWARRRLDAVADEELRTDEAATPSPDDIEAGLSVHGSISRGDAEALRARVHAARETPWRGWS